MSSYLYTNVIERIQSLENKIHGIEKMCLEGNFEHDFGLKNNSQLCDSVMYLVNLAKNLKQDLLRQPLTDNKKLSNAYNKINNLESELNILLETIGQRKNVNRCPTGCSSKRVWNVGSYTGLNNSEQISRISRKVSIKNKPNRCVPHEYFFEKIPSSPVLKNQYSSDHLERMIYYDESSPSSSSSDSTLIDEDYKPRKKERNVYFKREIPFDVRKSRSKPSVLVKRRKSKSKSPRRRKVSHPNFSVSKQPKKSYIRKDTKKKHKPRRRRRHSVKFRLSKSESPSFKVYSSKTPKKESEIYFVRRTSVFPKDKGLTKSNSSNKEKFFISRLKRINTPSEGNLDRRNKSQRSGNSSLVSLQTPGRKKKQSNKRKSNKKTSRFGVFKSEDIKKFEKRNSGTSIESRYIKAKWKRNRHKNDSEHQKQRPSKSKSHSTPIIMTNSSNFSRTAFLQDQDHHYGFIVTPQSVSSSSSAETLMSDQSYPTSRYGKDRNGRKRGKLYRDSNSSEELTHLTSSDISFINSNYVMVGSFYDDPNSVPVIPLSNSKITPRSHYPIYSHKKPTTVYAVTNDIPQGIVRLPNSDRDHVVFIRNDKSDTIRFVNSELSNKNIVVLEKENKALRVPKIIRNKNSFISSSLDQTINNVGFSQNKSSPASSYDGLDNKSNYPFGKKPIEQSVYLANAREYQNNFQGRPFLSNLDPEKNDIISTYDSNFPESSSQSKELSSFITDAPRRSTTKDQVSVVENEGGLVLSKAIRGMSQNKENHAKTDVASPNVTLGEKVESTKIYQNAKGSDSKLFNDKKKVKKSLSKQSSETKKANKSASNLSVAQTPDSKTNSMQVEFKEGSISSKKPLLKRKKFKDLSRNTSKSNLSDANVQLDHKLSRNSTTEIGEAKRSSSILKLPIGNLIGRRNKAKKTENSINRSVSFPQKSLSNGQPRTQNLFSKEQNDDSLDSVFDVKAPRSISKLLEQMTPSDSILRHSENENNSMFQDRSSLSNMNLMKNNSLKQNVVFKDDLNNQKSPSLIRNGFKTNQTNGHQPLNYSLCYTREKRRNVEMDSIPSTLSLAGISPSNCKTVLSTQEMMLSEHKLNGTEEHGRWHELVVRPKPSYNDTIVSKKRNKELKNVSKKVPFSRIAQECHLKNESGSYLHSDFLKYYRDVPVTRSVQIISDSSSSLDWKKIVDEIKKYN